MLTVMKFGGSSVADLAHIRNVAQRCIEKQQAGSQVVVVLSAMGKTTDGLIATAKQITEKPSRREMDMLLATGEQVSVSLMAITMIQMGVSAVSLNAWQVPMHTTSDYQNARFKRIDTERIRKELDDNNPNKNDRKDPKTIAALVNEGRFSYPYIPTGIYAEIRSLSNLRFQTQEELTRIKNRIARWFAIYFPEYKDVYGDLMAVSGRMILKEAPLPEDIRILGVNGVNQIWRNAKLRGTGMKRAKILVSAAEHSVGSKEAPEAARIELKNLLNDMDVYVSRMEELLQTIEEKLKTIPYVDKLMEIKGIGLITVSGFIAEVGDIGRFDNPKQLQKLAGYAIVANDSGKHNGESRISYRGRKRLRYVLYEAAISLVGKNAEFKEIHEYYRTRKENPLKKMQSVVAVACKIIRVFYTILTKGVDYDPMKLMSDIRRPQLQAA